MTIALKRGAVFVRESDCRVFVVTEMRTRQVSLREKNGTEVIKCIPYEEKKFNVWLRDSAKNKYLYFSDMRA